MMTMPYLKPAGNPHSHGMYTPNELDAVLHNDELRSCCIYGFIHAWVDGGMPEVEVGSTIECARGHRCVTYLEDGKWGTVDLLDVEPTLWRVYDGQQIHDVAPGG